MEKKSKEDLYCFQCMLQFDKKSIFDMHLTIVHNYVHKTEPFVTEIKNETEETKLKLETEIHFIDNTQSSSMELTVQEGQKSIRYKSNDENFSHKTESFVTEIKSENEERKLQLETEINLIDVPQSSSMEHTVYEGKETIRNESCVDNFAHETESFATEIKSENNEAILQLETEIDLIHWSNLISTWYTGQISVDA